MPTSHTIHLVDASPYIFRAYFALPSSMTTPDGAQVNAAYGFAGFLLRLIAEEQVSHLALAFDESLDTSFRNEIYPPYKAQRDPPPPELVAQLQWCQQISAALGACNFVDPRYEADDLIGTLSDPLLAAGHRIVVVSSDKDLGQLVGERVEMLDFAKQQRYGVAEIEAKFGVRPEQIPDYLGLAGDAVDNIPGVAGVGAKTAAALLAQMPTLEAIYERLDEVAELPIRGAKSLAKKLAAQREIAVLSKQLATIARDAPATASLTQLRYLGAQAKRVDPLFAELGFGRIRGRIQNWAAYGS